MAYTLTTVLYTGTTGQTLTAQLVTGSTGVNVGSAIATGFQEIGNGFYAWTYSSIPDGHRGWVEFLDSGTVVAATSINPEEAEYVGDLTTTGQVTITNPVAANLDIEIIRGDDYHHSDTGREIAWTNPDGDWPDLTGATITFGAGLKKTPSVLQITGEVVTPTGAGQKIRVDIAADDTADLSPETYRYDVQAALTNGRTVTLASGKLELLTDYAE